MGGRAEIAAMIAHEVRGPVSTVRGLAGTALSHYDRLDDDERRELLGLIEQESRRLLATVTQASTALKVDAATVTYDIRPQGLAATVREGIATADVGPASARTGSGGRGGPARPEVDHRGRPPAGGQRGEVLAAGRPDPRERPGRGRRDDDRGDRPRARASPSSAVTTCSTSIRTGVPTGTSRKRAPGWVCSSSAASSLGHLGEVHIVDAPGGGTMLRVRIPDGGLVGRRIAPRDAADLRRPPGTHRCAGDRGGPRRTGSSWWRRRCRTRSRRSTCAPSSCRTSC